MNIKEKIEDWLLNKFLGKIVARGTVTLAGAIAGILAGPKAGPLLATLAANGASISLDPDAVAKGIVTAAIGGAHWVYEWFKARRMANPNSPAVQTDKDKILPPLK